MIGSAQEPVVEESRETIDAQMEALEAGTIPVVMLPVGATYNPVEKVTAQMRVVVIGDCPGAGAYIFDPAQIKVATVISMVKAGRHHELLGHVQSKAEIGTRPWAVVRAVRDGVVLQDSLVVNESYWVEKQADALRARFPGAEIVYGDSVPRILEDRTAGRQPTSVLHAFKQDGYRIGNFQAIGYLRTRTDVFPEGFLGDLYRKMKTGSSGKPGKSFLEKLFCGMGDTSFDAIVAYLSSRPLCVMGEWRGAGFEPAGFIFPTVNLGSGDQKAAFAGYGFFREWWGTEDEKTLAVLGLSFFFVEMGIVALHGMRYSDNSLTKNFLSTFGFRETGRIPRYMLRGGKLVDGVASTLLREDFESYVERWLCDEYQNGRDLQDNEQG